MSIKQAAKQWPQIMQFTTKGNMVKEMRQSGDSVFIEFTNGTALLFQAYKTRNDGTPAISVEVL